MEAQQPLEHSKPMHNEDEHIRQGLDAEDCWLLGSYRPQPPGYHFPIISKSSSR